jgi:O-antigen ligase
MLWSIAPLPELIEGGSKYRKLLFAIFFLLVMIKSPSSLWLPLKAFSISNGLLSVLACALWMGFDQWRPPDNGIFFVGDSSNPTIGRNHISQGAFQVMSACLSLGFACISKSRAARYGWIFVATVTLFSSLGLLQGRTGYLLALVAVVLAILFLIAMRYFLPALIVAVLGLAVLSASWTFSLNFSKRTAEAIEDVRDYSSETNVNKSQGIRLQFYAAGLEIYKASPIIGHGAGSFAEAYAQLPDQNPDLQLSRAQPHSEYIILMVQGGSVALLLFVSIGFFGIRYSLHKHISHCQSPEAIALAILVGLYWVGAGVNSYLWDLAEGHLFILILGTVVARRMISQGVIQR